MKNIALVIVAGMLMLAGCKDHLPTQGGNDGGNNGGNNNGGNNGGNNGTGEGRIYYTFFATLDGWPTIYSMKPDGTDRRPITTGFMASPPGNGKIAYWLGGEVDPSAAYVADINGGNPVLLARGTDSTFDPDMPMLSPDGKKIAYSTTEGIITVTNTDSSSSWVVSTMGATRQTRPTFSPDGSKLAFHGKDGALYVMKMSELGTGAPQTVATGTRDYIEGYSTMSWSPDSKKIAYVGYNGDDEDIFVVNLENMSIVNMTNDEAEDGMPVFSPDGTKIAYGKMESGLWIINADGTNNTRIIQMGNNEFPVWPQWSPDGTRIIYLTDLDDGVGTLWMLNVGTKQTQRLFENVFKPFWVR